MADPLIARLRRADPYPASRPEPDHVLAGRDEVLTRIRRERHDAPVPRARRRRRVVALSIGAAILVGGSAAGTVLLQSQPREVTDAIAVDPNAVPSDLRPAGSAELALRAQLAGQTWQVWRTRSRVGREIFWLHRAGDRAVASGACKPLAAGDSAAVCLGGVQGAVHFLVGRTAPQVAALSVIGQDGRTAPAAIEDGVFLALLDGTSARALRPEGARGRQLDEIRLRRPGG